MNPLSDQKIIDSWRKNATPWAAAVRHGQIESRQRVTDRAIVETVLSRSPKTVIDIGCGEGWLARALHAHDVAVHGVDGVPDLIERARSSGGGTFETLSYEEIASGTLRATFDAVVCNFSLLGKESVSQLFQRFSSLLNPEGALIIQTLHPLMAGGKHAYQDGWRQGSWAGFSQDFTDPAPWYFRTLGSWTRLFSNHGLLLIDLLEPLYPQTGKPASAIFIAVSS